MGRIKNDNLYIFDSPASKFDKVIGSDAESDGRTKNYLLGELFALFAALGGGGVFSYTYTSDLADLDILEGLVATNDSETNPDGVNLFRFSRTDLFGNDLRTLVENYNNNSDGVVLKVTSEADPNLICAYTITGININTNWVEVSVLRHKNLNTLTFEVAKNFALTFDLVNLNGFGGGGGATNTSQLVNDGEDGINPFISLQDLITDHTALSNIGVNTHDQIDTHISDPTIHFTQGDISITESQISDLQSYLLVETDPVFSAWLATPPNVSIFTNDSGYLTSFTETDPIFLASPAGSITNTDITNWDMAFGWGNHALAGYLYITDIDTFAELDGLVFDANLVKEGDNVSVFVNDGVYMTEAVYDPAGISEQLVGLTSSQTIQNKNLSNTGYINFDITYVPTGLETTGTMFWNSTDETLDLVRNGTVMQLGQELYIRVRNTTGSTILNGVAVYSSAHTGIFPDISLAQGNSDATGNILGITTEDITDNSFGVVTTFGYVRGIKTDYTGSGVWGTTWAENDRLWVSKDVTGGLTNVEPSAPHHSDEVGVVGVVHPTQGTILVGINRHKRFDQLSDVNGTATDTNGQIAVWDNDNQVFDFTANINDYLLNTTDTLTGDLTVTGAITGSTIVKDGGLSTEFLKADGSVDTNTYSLNSHTHTFTEITSKPTTILGYGITDAYTKTEADGKYLLNTTDTLTGNLTITGITNTANLEFSASNPFMLGMDNDGVLSIVGGDSILTGAAIRLYGGVHATLANDITFISDNVNVGYWDDSASAWNFSGAIISAGGNITGGSFIKNGGLSTEFLKADGSVDSNTYALNSALSGYVPTSRTITVNGVSQDLSVNRTYTVSTITGNAGTATALQTARTINGTSFNGTANITTANWGTTRTITIGAVGKSVNGGANVSWSTTEIGITKTNIDALGINAATLDSIDSSQFLRSDVDDTKTGGNLSFNDGVKAIFGTGGNTQFQFAAGNMYTDLYTGNWYIRDSTNDRFTFDRANGRLGIGITSPETKLHLLDNTVLGGVAGNNFAICKISTSGGAGGNIVSEKLYALRDATGTDWTTFRFHNSIDVDGAFNTPSVNTRSFWERDPNIGMHYFGDQNKYTLTVDGGNNRVGVNNTNPTYSFDVSGTGRFTGDVIVPDEAYGVGWDGSTEVPTKNAVYDKIQNVEPYKKYVAKIFQTGTADPTVIVYENTLGGTVVWTRTGVGTATGTLTGGFSTTTMWFSTTSNWIENTVSMNAVDANEVNLNNYNTSSTGFLEDDWFAYIEIRVYP